MYLRLNCTQHYALAAPYIGLAPKFGDIGVFTINLLLCSELLLSSHAALFMHRCLAIGVFIPLEYSLLDIAISDE